MIFFSNVKKSSFVLGGSVKVSSIWKITRLAKRKSNYIFIYYTGNTQATGMRSTIQLCCKGATERQHTWAVHHFPLGSRKPHPKLVMPLKDNWLTRFPNNSPFCLNKSNQNPIQNYIK